MNITVEVEQNGLLYDRAPTQQLSLPYNLKEVTIQPNDIVSSQVINLKLQHLHENFLYLFTRSKICSNIIPISSTATMGLSTNQDDISENLTWKSGLSTSQFVPVIASALSAFNAAKVVYAINNPERSIYQIIMSDGKQLLIMYSNYSETALTQRTLYYSEYRKIFSNSAGAPESNNINYQNIVAITKGPRQSLLVLDQGANTLFQYDAKGFLTDDNIYSQAFFFKDLIGEYGTAQDKLSFNAPSDVVTYNNNIYVLDSGNSCIKRYDENLNWVRTYLLNRDFYYNYPQKLKVDHSGNFYCLLSGNKINVYSNDFQNKNVIDIDYINNTETPIDIAFSEKDPLIYYVVTNQNVYKGLTSDLNNIIGKYLLYQFKYNNTQTISAFATFNFGGNDKNLLISSNPSSHAGIMTCFYDNKNLYDNLAIADFDIYNLDNILIDSEEYMQSWVINKSISKLIANHLRFIDQLIGKFQFKYDDRGNSVFKFTRYLTAEEKQKLTTEALGVL